MQIPDHDHSIITLMITPKNLSVRDHTIFCDHALITHKNFLRVITARSHLVITPVITV